jgi:hypothetical protein
VDLAGDGWRFRTGDDPAWSDPAFVDTGWDAWPVPADGLLRWGAANVLAVRVYDGTGGGGFHQGPIGLFSKARLRARAGITGTAATPAQLGHACAVLGKQRRALAAGGLRAYGKSLAGGFFHQGDTAARRLGDLRGRGRVTLRDSQAEVFADGQGRLVVDTIRSWTAADGTVLLPPNRELLYLDPRRDEELGDHSASSGTATCPPRWAAGCSSTSTCRRVTPAPPRRAIPSCTC